MKKLYQKIKSNKIFTSLFIVTIIGIITGIFIITFLDKDNKNILEINIIKFFNNIKDNSINYNSSLFKSITNNLLINIIIWILGISIIGIIIIPIILYIKSFITSFTFVSIIYIFKFKGILIGLIYILPHLISLFIFYILSYYSISFSIYLFKLLFKNTDINKKILIIRYLKVLGISTITLLFISFIEIFIIPNILKLII